MLNLKDKKANLKNGVIYIALGVFLLSALVSGLVVWYVFYPAFKDLILWLGIVFTCVIVYFLILRGVFLGVNSGYFIDENFIVIKDGYPNSKKHVIKLSQVKTCSIKKNGNIPLIIAISVLILGIIAGIICKVVFGLNVLVMIAIFGGAILFFSYFLAIYLLSRGLGKLTISDYEKSVTLKNVRLVTLYQLAKELERKEGGNEI